MTHYLIMKMFQFFILPDIISTAILSDWLTTRELFVLDTAICNIRHRAHYLKIIQYKSFSSHGLELNDTYNHQLSSYFELLKLRQMKIKNLKIYQKYMRDGTETFSIVQKMWDSLGQHCCELQNLDISEGYMSIKIAGKLGLMFPSLRVLNMNRTRIIDTDFIFDVIVDNFKKLESLSISHCQKLNTAWVSLLVQGCRELSSLDISHCDNVNNDTVVTILTSLGPQLEYLDISGCSLSIKHATLQKVVGCPLLRCLKYSFFELHIDVPYLLQTESLDSFDDSHPGKEYRLQVFHLEIAVRGGLALPCLGPAPSKKVQLWESLIQLIHLFPPLSALSVEGFIPELGMALRNASDSLHKLHTLSITSGSVRFSELREVLEQYSSVRHVRIAFCKQLSLDNAMSLQAAHPKRLLSLSTPDVEYDLQFSKLVLRSASSAVVALQNSVLVDTLHRFADLHTIELYKCKEVTDEALKEVEKCHAQSLRSLSVIYCSQISTEAVIALIGPCYALKSLTLFENQNAVTEEHVLSIVIARLQLEWFQCCERVVLSVETAAIIHQLNPMLRFYK